MAAGLAKASPLPVAGERPVVAAAPMTYAWTAAEAKAHFTAAESDFTTAISAIGAIPADQRTFANTIQALEDAQAAYDERVAPAGFLSLVSPDAVVRGALTDRLVTVLARLPDAARAYDEYSSAAGALSSDQRLLMDRIGREFRLEGRGLSEKKIRQIQILNSQIVKFNGYFRANLWGDSTVVAATRGEMSGVPAGEIDGIIRREDGSALISVNRTAAHEAVVDNAVNPDLRRRVALAHARLGGELNEKDLRRALHLRRFTAGLMGFPSYAHLAMDGRETDGPRATMRWLGRLRAALAPAVQREDAALVALKRRDDPTATRLEFSDIPFYTKRLHASLGFDENRAMSYFPVEPTITRVLSRLEPLLGVRFTATNEPTWHSSVRRIAIEDQTGRRLGSLYLDLYQREGKIGGRFAQPLIRGRILPDGSYREPVAAVVTNFAPSGLAHADIIGLMHELGHGLDDVLTRARFSRFAGGTFGVGLDRTEIPSQLLEQLAWNVDFLSAISGREGDSGRPIPAEIRDAMIEVSRIGRARTIMTWIANATIDLALHWLRVPVDIEALVDRVFARCGLTALPSGHLYAASFSHLMGLYSAGYYTYLTTMSRALDLYGRFTREGLANPLVGEDYRRLILEPGGEAAYRDAARAFLGRDPDPSALEKFLRSL
jgi:Zn-dependent oligopeptidase